MRLPLPWLPPDAAAEAFPASRNALQQPNGLLCAGGDLSPARLLVAYSRGIFPWYSEGEPILWWTPQPRCVLPLDTHRIAKRLQRSWRSSNWQLSADRDFPAVMEACAAPRSNQPGTWITADMRAAYIALHQLGYAHSVEVRDPTGTLIGGIYGIALGRVFFGESMFSRADNASKTALHALALFLRQRGFTVLDGQVESDHLRSLGFELWSRTRFEQVLPTKWELPHSAGSWQALWPWHAVAQLPQPRSTN